MKVTVSKNRSQRMPQMGPYAVAYYEALRKVEKDEARFWASWVVPGTDVLEIGSGTGQLSVHLARRRPRSLTLVESSPAMVRGLQRRMREFRSCTRLRVVESAFESRRYPAQDRILFAYDSLPLLCLSRDRKKLFYVVERTLRPGGVFVVHFTTASEARALVRSYSGYRRGSIQTERGPLEFRKCAFAIDDGRFGLDLSLWSVGEQERENYRFTMAILQPREVVHMAEAAGLRFHAAWVDFRRTPGFAKRQRQQILVFEKPQRSTETS